MIRAAPSHGDDDPVLMRVAIAVLAVGALVSLAALVCTWDQPVLEAHSFRQTQTAITAYWLGKGGPFFAYETPVLGAPWSVPFELPLYQAVVAGVHGLGVELDAAGRLVSWLVFALTLWQVQAIVRKLGGSRHLGFLLCGLVLCSPHYIFWSRTFMIESTALCCSVAFVSVVIGHVRAPRPWSAAAMVVLASLAALVKVTTFVPFGAIGGLVVVWELRHRAHRTDARRWLTRYAPVALAGVVAIALVALWNAHADALKQDHPFGRNLTSSNLRPWLYGSWAQRRSPILWRDVVFGRSLDEALGGKLPLLAALAAAIAFGRAALAWFGCLLALYLAPFLVFTNLHWVHDYYQYANALFAICAIGVVAWHAGAGWRRWVAYALVGLVLAMQAVRLVRVEWPTMVASKDASDTMSLRRALRGLPEDGVLLVFGYDWSAEAAYYAEHRAITVPAWASREQLESLRDRPAVHAGGLPIVAVVECPHPMRASPELGPIVESIFAQHTRGKQRTTVAACTLWR